MNIEVLDLKFIDLPIILPFLVVGVFIFTFTLYYLFHQNLKTNVIFDIGWMILIGGFFFSRLLGFLDDISFYEKLGWSFLPLEDSGSSIFINHKLPWEFVNILDGNFYLIGFPIGMILAAVFIYLISNKAKGINYFLDTLILAIIPFQLIVLIGAFVSQLYYHKSSSTLLNFYIDNENGSRMSTISIEIIILILFCILLFVIKRFAKKDGVALFTYLFSQGVVIVFLISNLSQTKTPIIFVILGVIILFVATMLLVGMIIDLIKQRKKIEEINQLKHSDEIIVQRAYSDIEITQTNLLQKIRKFFRWGRK